MDAEWALKYRLNKETETRKRGQDWRREGGGAWRGEDKEGNPRQWCLTSLALASPGQKNESSLDEKLNTKGGDFRQIWLTFGRPKRAVVISETVPSLPPAPRADRGMSPPWKACEARVPCLWRAYFHFLRVRWEGGV